MRQQPQQTRTPLPIVCPEYDADCRTMTVAQALECWLGFPDNEHAQEFTGCGPEGIGRAAGICPILARLN